MEIAGKKAIVLGGTSGIGLATSIMLVGKGVSVVAVSRDPSKASDVPDGIRLAASTRAMRAMFRLSLRQRERSTFWSIQQQVAHAPLARFWKWTCRVSGDHSTSCGAMPMSCAMALHFVADDGAIVLVSGSPARKPKPGQIALSAVGGAVGR